MSKPIRPVLSALVLSGAVGCAPAGSSSGAAGASGRGPDPAAPARATLPSVDKSRKAVGPDADKTDVSSLVGKPAPGWELSTWLNGAPRRVEDLRGQVVLVRWFMSAECPYCSATAPALLQLHEAYADKGLTIIGMYHHKGDPPMVIADVKKLVSDHYKFRFPVAIDEDWKTLKRWWLDDHPKSWTSVSFLIDHTGTVRYAHTGGAYPPGSEDYVQMKTWIEGLLSESRR